MEYSYISWIQRIETCISRGAAEWNTRFQWVEWRKYDYISWVDQVNNFWTPQASNCPLFSLKNWIKVTPQMKRLVNMNLVFHTFTNIFEKLVNIIPVFHTLSCIHHLHKYFWETSKYNSHISHFILYLSPCHKNI